VTGRCGRALFVVLAALTLAPSAQAALPDSRGWELVSPAEKNGAQLDGPETVFGGGAFQAAAQGGALTYTSAASFAGPQGSPGASQYLSRRGAGGWSTENLTVAQLAGAYDTSPEAGAPYRLFSADLGAGLLTNGRRCRGEGVDCPVANPPLPGSGAPAGYRNYYLRDNTSASFKALLASADLASLALGAEEFELDFVAATPDLSQVVLSTCAALTTEAIEVAGSGDECDPEAQNLYLRSATGLKLINLLPGQSPGTPGAELAAQAGAISSDGSRVYFSDETAPAERNLYLREGAQTKQVDAAAGGGGTFQAASTNGAVAFYTKGTSLYRYDGPAGTGALLATGVQGVLGASPDGSYLYFLGADGLYLWHGGTSAKIATSTGGGPAANEYSYPPATGTARVSADGTKLAFLSTAILTGFDPKGAAELYLYSTTSPLRCISCNTLGKKPLGPAAIPGAVANGAAFKAYKPRALSDAGDRLFFNSKDGLVSADTNADQDVYQWEAQGTGSCAKAGGCVELISTGHAEDGASFIDASADGSDVFFATSASLVAGDPGGLDLYDARVGGGFPALLPPIPCVGDACQPLPGEPEDPTPGTLLQGLGNQPLHLPKAKKKAKKKGHHHRKHAKGRKHGRRAR
jgi:hypothetical protein